MSVTMTDTARASESEQTPAGAFASVLNAVVGTAAAKLEEKVVGWADRLDGVAEAGVDELAEGGGAKQAAGAEAAKAGLRGRNPVWAAVKGAWQAGTPVVRAAIVTALVAAILLLLLSPVLLLVFLLSLLVIAAVHRARAAGKR